MQLCFNMTGKVNFILNYYKLIGKCILTIYVYLYRNVRNIIHQLMSFHQSSFIESPFQMSIHVSRPAFTQSRTHIGAPTSYISLLQVKLI